MQTFGRLAMLFGVPALLLAAVSLCAWLAIGAGETDLGPMRLAPLVGAGVVNTAVDEPPPNTLLRIPPQLAKLRNALLPYARAGFGSATLYHPDDEPAATAGDCLAQAVYYEAANEPEAGKRAVAQVIINRAARYPFPSTICGVVQQGMGRPGCQFTFMCDGSLQRRPDARLFAEARRVADAALAGGTEPSVGDATHYHADYVFPRWAPTMLKLTKIGAHIFYRWPGATLKPVGRPVNPAATDGAAGLAEAPIAVDTAPWGSKPSGPPLEAPEVPPPGPLSGGGDPAFTSPTPLAPANPPAATEPATPPASLATPVAPRPSSPPRRAIPERPLGSGPI